jgi:hypothetical protein
LMQINGGGFHHDGPLMHSGAEQFKFFPLVSIRYDKPASPVRSSTAPLATYPMGAIGALADRRANRRSGADDFSGRTTGRWR